MVPYEKSERLAAVRKDFHYELHKRKVPSNVARNSMVFVTEPTEELKRPSQHSLVTVKRGGAVFTEAPHRASLQTIDSKAPVVLPTINGNTSRHRLSTESIDIPPHSYKNMIEMSRMAPRSKEQEMKHQSRVELHWEKTSKLLQKMGFVRKQRFDRLLLEELGLVGMLDEDEDSDYE